MYARILSAARPGIFASIIAVEADVLPGLPGLNIVGLPDHALRESRDRIRAAISNAGFRFPARQIVINLSPSDMPKEGGLLEAAMAVAVLVATQQVAAEPFAHTAVLGSLSLSGDIVPARGLAAAAIFAAGEPAIQQIIVPHVQEGTVTVPDRIGVYSLRNLSELPLFCHGGLQPSPAARYKPHTSVPDIHMENIFGLAAAKHALAVAAAGGHHVLMVGTPGSGKSLLARAFRHLPPAPSFSEAAEITRLWSLAGFGNGELICERPFRSPHHTISTPALVGGSSQIRPGEISLAHNGVLFLDELPEFRNEALQSLREPLEERRITIARARGHVTFPAKFQLIAAANPCRCGYLFVDAADCQCRRSGALDQFMKLLGPFLDRIALEINLNELPDFHGDADRLTTSGLRTSIAAARLVALERNEGHLNSELDAASLFKIWKRINPQRLFDTYARGENLSMRAWLNVLRVGLSAADLAGDSVSEYYLKEAMAYRFVARKLAVLRRHAA